MSLSDHLLGTESMPGPSTTVTYHFNGNTSFPRVTEEVMGFGIHRSGWQDCYRALAGSGIRVAIDDFVEQTILQGNGAYHDRPFVGFFHYPPDDTLPDFAQDKHAGNYERLFKAEAWEKSKPHLLAAICLSDHLAEWLRQRLPCPVFVVRHPTEQGNKRWSPRAFAAHPTMVQVGAFCRDTRVVAKLEVPIEKCRLLDTNTRWIAAWDRRIGENLGPLLIPADVRHINRVNQRDYDELLSKAVILTHFLAASASNVVVECIARETPLVVNRHPAVVEYLGDQYPLYSENLSPTFLLL